MPGATTSDPAANAPSGTFVRQASGLVRQASWFDAFIFNSYFINIGMGVAFMILMYPLYPGANLVAGHVHLPRPGAADVAAVRDVHGGDAAFWR